jgi:hypothetical protein
VATQLGRRFRGSGRVPGCWYDALRLDLDDANDEFVEMFVPSQCLRQGWFGTKRVDMREVGQEVILEHMVDPDLGVFGVKKSYALRWAVAKKGMPS